jgi:dimethylglycine dehydrogenase
MRNHARVVVIGGGAMGCSLLYHLTKLGWHDVVLVEKHELTAGSTWHAAGLCTHFAHNLTVMHMRAYSARLYRAELSRDTGKPVSFHSSGALRVTRSGDRMDEFRHVQGLGRFAGIDFHILSPAELKQIHPLASTHDIIGAFYEPHDGHVDPNQATQAMAAGARARGAEIYRHNPVEAIEAAPGGEWAVHTRNGSIRCDIVVNAAGTWAREIGDMMGLDIPVVPMLHQYIVTNRVAAVAALDRELPIIRDPEESWYMRQERDGLIVGPYERNGHPWGVDGVPKDFGMELLPPDLGPVEDILLCAMQRVPAFADAGIKTVVNGPITFTPDAGPLIGPAFGLRNAWLLTGSSMGVMEGGGAGKFLSEWIAGGEPPMDPLAVDPRRFGAYADRDYRVAKAVESFANQFGIHFPYEERSAGRPKLKSPTYDELKHRGAVFGSVYGWERPNWFDTVGRGGRDEVGFRRPGWFDEVGTECRIVRDSLGFADMSPLAKFEVSGPGADIFLASLGANRPPRKLGGVALTHPLTAGGGVLSELTVTKLDQDHYYLTGAAAARRHDLDVLTSRAAPYREVTVQDTTVERGVLVVAGPLSRQCLQKLTDADLRNQAFPWLACREIVVAGFSVRALRVSYVGELGWELHCAVGDQLELFRALKTAGRTFDATLFGAYAINALRLEKGYRAWGMDLTTERTPLEAGLGHLVRLEDRDFVGRASLVAHESRSPRLHMALVEILGEGPDPFYGHPVCRGDRVVGLVTSGAYGHRTGKKLALAYLAAEAGADDSSLSVEVLGERHPASILPRPPYDPENIRLKG